MKRLFLLIAIYLMFIVAGDTRPMANLEEIPLEMYWELTDILRSIDYRGWRYEIGVFDCTNMTAYMYDYLTAREYECEIIGGVDSIRGLFKGEGHAWLIAKKDGKKFWIESVFKSIVSRSDYDDYYFFQLRLGSLKTTKILFTIIGFPHEWDY